MQDLLRFSFLHFQLRKLVNWEQTKEVYSYLTEHKEKFRWLEQQKTTSINIKRVMRIMKPQ